ncbi:MAG: SPOR domain-containing protein [bacterium]|nr:SPOR domain-containing protein [bacterium]
MYPAAIIVCATALYFFWPTLARNRPETRPSEIKSEISTMIGEDTAIARDSVRLLPVDVDSIAGPRVATDISDSLIAAPKVVVARDSSVASPDTSINRASSPVAAVEPPTAVAAESAAYAVHVASFLQPERAISMAQHFKDAGYPAEYRENKIANTIWHRVILGPYPDRAAAVAAGRAVVDAGLTTYTKVVEF